MSQPIYHIQLLNDLHNYFPELLYNPRRFQNIQDVLGYIRSVAEVSPYDIGLQMYNNNRPINQRVQQAPPLPMRHNVTTVPNNIPPIAPSPTPTLHPLPAGAGIPINSTIPQTFVTMFDEIPTTQGTRVRMTMNNNTNALMNTLLGGLFGDIMGGMGNGINLNSFLNERVLVYPTNDEIENASNTFRATRRQDDICAICQEDIENNQQVRRLTHCNHYFHQDCIDTWFRGNVHCPTCRHDIRDGVENSQTNRNYDNPNDRNNNINSNPPPVPENHRRTNIRRPDNS